MRITMVTPYEQERDGLADYSAALIGELEPLGHEVSVLLPCRGRGELSALPHLPALPNAGSIRRLFASLERPDLIHVQFAVSAFHTQTPALFRLLDAAEINDVPVVATLHEVARDLDLLGPVGAKLYRSLVRRCTQLLVHTDSAKERLVRELGADESLVEVVPHFQRSDLPAPAVSSDALRARVGIAPDDAVLLSFGFIHVDKGLDTLVEAWLALRERRSDLAATARLVVAGEVRRRSGAFRVFELRDHAHLRAIMQRLTEADAVRDVVFAGHVPEAEVAAWFHTSTIAVLPYRAIEQSGVANLARATGLPIAVSRIGELPKLTTPDLTFPADDVDALSRVLEQCLAAPPPRSEPVAVSAGGPSLAATGRRLGGIYEAVARERSRVVVDRAGAIADPAMSVVVCSYNGSAGLRRCLRALQQQAGVDGRLEIIVVDDGSTDDTAAIAREAGVTVVSHLANRGAAAARNTGMLAASAAYVGFLDDDCEPSPGWAQSLLRTWDAVDTDVSIVGGPLDPVVADTIVGRFTRRHDPLKPLEIELAASTDLAYRLKLYMRRLRGSESQRDLRRVFSVASANLSVRRDAALAKGGFDERFRWGSEDVELCRRVADGNQISPIVFDPEVRAKHHFVGTLRDTVRRSQSYGRGAARLSRARSDVPPTIFPGPIAAVGLLAVAPWFPAAAVAAIALPPLLYGVKSSPLPAERDDTQWMDAYLTLLQESAANVGFASGWRANRFLAPSSGAPRITLRTAVRDG